MYDERWMNRRKLFEEEIPLFTYENALEFNAVDISGSEQIDMYSWWYGDNLQDRLAFVDWMIEVIQLKEDKFVLNSF